VNRELILPYWQIGRNILDRQAQQGWGAKMIERLSPNFEIQLSRPHSDLARESLKDPYRLDFSGLSEEADERAITKKQVLRRKARLTRHSCAYRSLIFKLFHQGCPVASPHVPPLLFLC
jgi:hypothetical protein